MQVTLTVIEGPHKGKTYTFAEHDTFLVGRASYAHFRLPKDDRYFSRVHFMVEVNPPCCRLMDMHSTNGTYVNGRRVETANLQDNDVIKGGRTLIRVAIEGAEQPGRVPEAQPRGASKDQTAAAIDQGPPRAPAAASAPASVEPPAALPEMSVTAAYRPPEWQADAILPSDYRQKIAQRPQPLSGYKIVEELGRGGMGVVYLAVREVYGTVVALKTIKPAAAGSPANLQRFLREANILRELRHPHIVAFEDMGLADGTMYFAMEYVPGTNVREILRRQGGSMPVGQAVRLVCQALDALAYAHSRGFVHRDVKPANLLVTTCDDRPFVKLSDFGLARMYHASQMSGLTMMGDVGGTVPYMAPEQITSYRQCQPAADQYSAAATLYHLLCGRYIYDFPEETSRKLLMILQEEPVPLERRRGDIPGELSQIIRKALARNPADRFPDCLALRNALLPFGRE